MKALGCVRGAQLLPVQPFSRRGGEERLPTAEELGVLWEWKNLLLLQKSGLDLLRNELGSKTLGMRLHV